MDREIPVPGELWWHYKNPDKLYTIVAIATNPDTEEKVVVYRSPQGESWFRAITNFMEVLGNSKDSGGTRWYRFTKAVEP